MRLLPIVVSVLLAGAACGGERPTSVTSSGKGRPSDAPSADATNTRYTATTTVLESPDHGPQLCLGGVQESYPPQCGGPDVIGWDWDVVQGEESANGTTWGTYTVVGTWDGEALTDRAGGIAGTARLERQGPASVLDAVPRARGRVEGGR
ncbi:MAG: hypothetical protein KY452_13460 [Actinobacteria bacterium]|nr:hypothetical protein [Actinomycetota bacterium]